MTNATPSLPPYLTDEEIAGICDPLVMPAAQRRYLARLGLLVQAKPNGRPLVARSEFERVLGADRFGTPQEQNGAPQPDWGALRIVTGGGKRGPQAKE